MVREALKLAYGIFRLILLVINLKQDFFKTDMLTKAQPSSRGLTHTPTVIANEVKQFVKTAHRLFRFAHNDVCPSGCGSQLPLYQVYSNFHQTFFQTSRLY